MKNLSTLNKICYIFGFLGVIFSIIASVITKKEFTWQIITLMWMGSSFMSDLNIIQLEDKIKKLEDKL